MWKVSLIFFALFVEKQGLEVQNYLKHVRWKFISVDGDQYLSTR